MVNAIPKKPARTRSKPKSTPANKAASASGAVRIIAGKWRGRKLPVHDVQGLRPTTDRIKETVFNWLAADIHLATCLDLFAGSGSLGLEALSRQAKSVTLVEKDAIAANQLRANLAHLNAENAKLIHGDAIDYLNGAPTTFDIVFIDPPFRQGLLNEVLLKLEQQAWLAENALIYIEAEQEAGEPPVPTNWRMLKQKQAGQVSFRLYLRE